MDSEPVKTYIIIYYEKLLKEAIENENYEQAAKLKKYIENLKKSNLKN